MNTNTEGVARFDNVKSAQSVKPERSCIKETFQHKPATSGATLRQYKD